MANMLVRSILLLAGLLAQAGCGGRHADAGLDLQGTWYLKDHGSPATYYAQHVMEQTGADVLITYCDRETIALRIAGSHLYDREGLLYYMQPNGADLLVGTGDTGQRSEARRFSKSTHFDSGRLNVTVSSVAPLAADRDVCAAKAPRRFETEDGTRVDPEAVIITAPYGTAFLRLTLAFKSFGAGDYAIRDFEGFVHSPEGAVYVEVESPDYRKLLGLQYLSGSAGVVHVRPSANGNFILDGSLTTSAGPQVTFSSDVVLDKPPQ